MATVSEIENAVNTTREQGCEDIVLLKCTSTYPASPSNSNISTLPHLKSLFNTEVGISDHTLGIGVPLVSIGFGATFIEKHFTLNRSDGGVDSKFSLEPNELKSLVIESKELGVNWEYNLWFNIRREVKYDFQTFNLYCKGYKKRSTI